VKNRYFMYFINCAGFFEGTLQMLSLFNL
jgi:hypothetical protein